MRATLPRLREIGFRSWDPLCLRESFESGEPMEDEYDGYLLGAFAAATDSKDIEKVMQILRNSETIIGVETSKVRRNITATAILQIANEIGEDSAA